MSNRTLVRVDTADAEELVDGFQIRRALPRRGLRKIGPFLLLDHMGPLSGSQSVEAYVPPHPHAGMETVTYLFDGTVLHRDSLGCEQRIQPGDVNWMTSGAGILHSEGIESREGRLHGVQIWVNLPEHYKESPPAFKHYPGPSLPSFDMSDARVDLIAGQLGDFASAVQTYSPLLLAHITFARGGSCELPLPEDWPAAVYVLEGELHTVDDAPSTSVAAGQFAVCSDQGDRLALRCHGPTHLMLLSGATLREPIAMYGTFVMTSMNAVDRKRREYANGDFGTLEE